MIRRCLRTALILLMTGTFVSATQAALARPGSGEDERPVETCFTETGMIDLSGLASGSSALLPASAGISAPMAADTLETYEIELEDEGKKGTNYKAIVGLVVAAAFVGYALYVLLVPDEEEEQEPESPTKPVPSALIRIPF